MRTLKTRFGEVTYDPDKVVHFPEGLIGFERLRDFIVMPNKNDDVLLCFQSVEELHVAFLLINPALFFPDYRVTVGRNVREKLAIGGNDPCFILTTITFHQDQTVTLNLLAPIVYTPKTDRAVQIVLEGSGYLTKTLLKSGVSSP
jgi:flagellar assembly factor FliW